MYCLNLTCNRLPFVLVINVLADESGKVIPFVSILKCILYRVSLLGVSSLTVKEPKLFIVREKP